MPSSDYPAMTVVQELERGYTLHDRVVRPSKVMISSGPPEPAAIEAKTPSQE
jgi:molecular chaperone GrpE